MRHWIGRSLGALLGLFLMSSAGGAADIPYRYPVQEGFILALDDTGRRSLPLTDPRAWDILNRIASVLESDRYRIPTEYGRTLAWNEGSRLTDGLSRADQLAIFNQARVRDASRAQPSSVLFIGVVLRPKSDGTESLRIRIDWVDLIRGEVETRYSMEPVLFTEDDAVLSRLIAPFFAEVGDDILDRLGPAPPRGYGDVPAAWLVEPVRYRVDLRDLPVAVRDEVFDAMTLDFPHYLSHDMIRDTETRLTLSYETIAPSWWLADRMMEIFREEGFAADITPRIYGLRVTPVP